jgi:hypothetical protein
MSMNSAHNRLKRAERDLLAKWDLTRQYWSDDKSREFADRHLEPLLKRSRAAHDALVNFETILTALRHDCE